MEIDIQENGKILLQFNKEVKKSHYRFFTLKDKNSTRNIYDFDAILTDGNITDQFDNGVLVRVAQNTPQKVRVVFSSQDTFQSDIQVDDKSVIISSLREEKRDTNQIVALFEHKERTQKPTETKNKAPTRKKSKKVVVLDAGHGGKDCGALGVAKICEKVIVLNLAKELQKELQKRGYSVFMTRSTDKFISLRERTEFANAKNADLFLSIHANAVDKSRSATLNGVETYFLSPARSKRAEDVAAAENKNDIEVMGHFSRQTVIGIISSQRLYASNRLAIDVQFGVLSALKKHYSVVDGGVREGPFWVLAGALMPSILLEIGYITHPKEGKLIHQNTYQKYLARGIADGIDGYFMKNF
ncbi:N-acetylmuramoyl-L-alanine amidase family protein [Helicobacter monodelphidis]|uniref:N-acetylmuramoyl-L-alanine amidase family protein n=1 Tax=Helicobacter sp. 15-1451 TaxID=2004995 RepID=UPI00215CE7E2|nr:N-acetylmuramoyl-L-alanine amidase [Helicobacter sp. 15-1451]